MNENLIKNRIWELDFARGVAVIWMIFNHLGEYLGEFAGREVNWIPILYFFKQYGGTAFIIISGLCVAFSKSSVKRGLVVFGCSIFVTAFSFLVRYLTGFEDQIIWWGILHMIGFAMIVYPLIKKLPRAVMLILALIIIVGGYYLNNNVFLDENYLVALGIKAYSYGSPDWWPILPNLGWFMLGVWLKPILYKGKRSLFPWISSSTPVINVICWCGRWSLPIYLIHRWILFFITYYLLRV